MGRLRGALLHWAAVPAATGGAGTPLSWEVLPASYREEDAESHRKAPHHTGCGH